VLDPQAPCPLASPSFDPSPLGVFPTLEFLPPAHELTGLLVLMAPLYPKISFAPIFLGLPFREIVPLLSRPFWSSHLAGTLPNVPPSFSSARPLNRGVAVTFFGLLNTSIYLHWHGPSPCVSFFSVKTARAVHVSTFLSHLQAPSFCIIFNSGSECLAPF